VRKYDASGNVLWTRQFGTTSDDVAYGISVDASGVYVAGYTGGTLPGQTSSGGYDAFVRKYDANGTESWTRQFGTSSTDYASGISVDASSVYVAGYTGGTLPGQTSSGSYDAFVRKYDASGNVLWTRQFGTTSDDVAYGISVDASGVYVAGYTNGTLPGQTSSGGYDAFVRKYDASGTESWTRQFGTTSADFAYGISVDASGVYVAGYTNGTLPGQTSSGSYDAFVRKYDASGNVLWTRQFGTSSTDYAYGISVDASSVYVAGYTGGTLPGQTSSGGADAFVMKMAAPNSPPVADAGGPYIATEGSELTLDASSSTDPDSDPLQYRWDFTNDSTWDTEWSASPLATYTWADDWSGNAKVEVTDGQLNDDATAQVTINNVAPALGEITAPTDPIAVTIEVNTSASFTDVGVLDTHTALWDWGDGTTSAGTVTETNGSGSATGSHAYTGAGVYTVNLTVTDKDGGSSENTFQYIVIYDPSAGFVTGGGWINSAAGAYAANPTLTGKATFGFVSKYLKGAKVPTGQTEFQFHVANLNFRSTSYEWLVVAGARAQYKGVGTINGTGDYGFMLTAVDGQISGGGGTDKFRIKIWNITDDSIVYDNQLGASDTVDPTTVISGGSIVIHVKK